MDNTETIENTAVAEAEDISDGAALDTEKDDTNFEEEKFEYDENGEVIIPEIEQTSEDDEEVEISGDDDTSGEFEKEETTAEGESTDGAGADNTDTDGATTTDNVKVSKDEGKQGVKVPVKSERETALERENERLKLQTIDTLKKLGYDVTDAYEGLLKVAAETEGKPIEEYRRGREQAENVARIQRERRVAAFNQKMAKDLSDIQAAFPETMSYKSITEIPNFRRFAEFSDKGLTAKEAYAASNPDAIRSVVAKAVKKQSLADTKSHLRPVTSKSAKDKSVNMKKSELNLFRDLFDGELSDREIAKLYKDTAN